MRLGVFSFAEGRQMASADEAAFWAALTENPTDDTARLAFADWLEDRTDPRSQWLRDAELARYMRPESATPLAAMVEAIQSDDYDAGAATVPLFSRLGSDGLHELLLLSWNEDHTWLRFLVGESLSHFDGEHLLPHLSDLIRLIPTNSDYICRAIAKIGLGAAPTVVPLLEAERQGVVTPRTLAETLAGIGPGAEAGVPRLVEIFCHDTDYAGSAAAEALAAIGLHTLDAALAGLDQLDDETFPEAMARLIVYNGAAISRFSELVTEPPGRKRTGALLLLCKLAPTIALPHLIDSLRGEAAQEDRDLLLREITAMGPAAVTAAPVLREMLREAAGENYQDQVAEALAAVTGDTGIPELVAQLDDPEPNFRRRTLRVLARLAGGHPDARSALLRSVADPDRGVRLEVLDLLTRVIHTGDEDVVEPLRPWLSDPDPEGRAAAIWALGRAKWGALPALTELLTAMHDPVENVRIAATRSVDGMQHEEPRMLAALLEALDDPSEEVRHAAGHGLLEWSNLYPEFTAAVFARVNDPDPYIARCATQLIGKATEQTPELVAYLRNTLRTAEDVDVRVSAGAGLARLKVTDPEVLAEVFALLDETANDELIDTLAKVDSTTMVGLNVRLERRPDLRYRVLCAIAWNRGEIDTTPALSGAISSLSDEESIVRSEAATVLGNMGQAAAVALPHLLSALADPDVIVRATAATAISKVAPNGAEVVSELSRCQVDDDAYVRKCAVDAIATLDVTPETKLPHLLAALHDADAGVIQQAASGMGDLGQVGAVAIPILIPLLSHTEREVRRLAAFALGSMGDTPESVTALRGLLADPEDGVRHMAVRALGNLGTAAMAAGPDLIRMATDDPDEDVRCAAAAMLVQVGAGEAAADTVATLVQSLWSESGETRAHAARSLGALGASAQTAVPELAKALRDPAWGDISKETWKRYMVMGMLIIPADSIEAIAAVDQRIYVVTALQNIGPPEVVIPLLIAAMEDANLLVGISATEAIRDLLPASEPAVWDLLAHADRDIRRRARNLLSIPHEITEDDW